jgi:hypothetical protein
VSRDPQTKEWLLEALSLLRKPFHGTPLLILNLQYRQSKKDGSNALVLIILLYLLF